jgi:hypothetical protein
MIDLRKLAAVDILFLGSKIILSEFTLGVLGPLALGLFILLRSHSVWQTILGGYLVSLGFNYVPLLAYAIAIVRHHSASTEVGEELGQGTHASFKYTVQSLVLLVPFLAAGIAIAQEWHKMRSANLKASP